MPIILVKMVIIAIIYHNYGNYNDHFGNCLKNCPVDKSVDKSVWNNSKIVDNLWISFPSGSVGAFPMLVYQNAT